MVIIIMHYLVNNGTILSFLSNAEKLDPQILSVQTTPFISFHSTHDYKTRSKL